MTAAEARAKSNDFHTNGDNGQYATVKDMIAQAVGKGEYECYIYNVPLSEIVRKKLEEEGFKIGATTHDRNETFTLIKW